MSLIKTAWLWYGWIFAISLARFINCMPPMVRIGALFSAQEQEQELAFRFAVNQINANETILSPSSQLIAQIERIEAEEEDSFHIDKKVCRLLNSGVAAIFGPLSGRSASTSMHVQRICDTLQIPHIDMRWDYQVNRSHFSLNLHPRHSTLAKAYVDLLQVWRWDSFAIAYEDSEGLMRVQDLFKEASQLYEWKPKLYQFGRGKPYHETFRKMKAKGEVNIVLDVRPQNMHTILKHAQQVGMMTEFHSYLITSLDLHTVNLNDFKYSGTRIAGYRLVDKSSDELETLKSEWSSFASRIGRLNTQPPPTIKTETALLYDAVTMLASGLRNLDQDRAVEIPSISCENQAPWPHGSSLINYMKSVEYRGMTGLVKFDKLGYRSAITLDLMSLTEEEGLKKIGAWTKDVGLEIAEEKQLISRPSTSPFPDVPLIVTTVIHPPFTMWREASHETSGNDRFEGFAIDLIQQLSTILHFKYKFKLSDDNAYGWKNAQGEWNGMISEIISGKADLAIADLTITSTREEAVDFTFPFLKTGVSILFKKPMAKISTLLSFLSPFSMVVWLYILKAYIVISLLLFTVARISPYEWDRVHPCRPDHDRVLENNFTLLNSFWFTMGAIMKQGSDIPPKAMSTRTIASVWYIFTIIMIGSYTANLAAFLTVERVIYPIESVEDLPRQTEIEYGCLERGSTRAFFESSNIPTYRKIWQYMSNNSHVFTKSNHEGVMRVEKGNYAFFMESMTIQYIIERYCNLTQIGGLLNEKGYGIATQKDSPYREPLSQAILQLQETGMLNTLEDRWWRQKRGGGSCYDETKNFKGVWVNELSLANVGGVFVVLLGGLALSFLIAICEYTCRALKMCTQRHIRARRQRKEDKKKNLAIEEEQEANTITAKSTLTQYLWNRSRLPKTPLEAVILAREKGLVPQSIQCERHKDASTIINYGIIHKGRYGEAPVYASEAKCAKCNESCLNRPSGTIFEAQLPPQAIFSILYGFATQETYEQARRETRIGTILPTDDTIKAWYATCREIVGQWIINVIQTEGKLGGRGKMVMIDEGVFGATKFDRGASFGGRWIVSMIEEKIEPDGTPIRMKLFVGPETQRNGKTLYQIIKDNVESDTLIWTDCWRNYLGIESSGYFLETVIRSSEDEQYQFVPITEVSNHVGRIDSLGRPIKDDFRLHGFSREDEDAFSRYLVEYLWRRWLDANKLDPFESLLEAIKTIYPSRDPKPAK